LLLERKQFNFDHKEGSGEIDFDEHNSGLIQYISIVVEMLLNEVLTEKQLSDKFEKRLTQDIKAMLTKIGSEVCVFLKELIDAEMIAGPYTADTSYVTTIQNVEQQIKACKDKESQPSTAESTMSFGQNTNSLFGKPSTQQVKPTAQKGSAANQITLGDDFTLDLSEVAGILTPNPSVEELAVFQMQISLFAYWSVLQKRLTDHVHLVIRSGVCHQLKHFEQLMEQIWRENNSLYVQILHEKSEVQEKRSILQQRICNLKKAADILTSLASNEEQSMES